MSDQGPSTPPLSPPVDPAGPVSTGWMWWALLPCGLGGWVPIVAGVRVRRLPWVAFGVAAIVVGFGAVALAPERGEGNAALYTACMLIGTLAWIATGTFTALSRTSYRIRRQATAGQAERNVLLQVRREERARAVRMAASDPERAIDLGIGRPDLPHAAHGHVVDINHAPLAVLHSLPGIDVALAARIIEIRTDLGPFTSLDDLAFTLDLAPGVTERLRTLAVTPHL